MKPVSILYLLIIAAHSFAQPSTGIRFENAKNWKEVLSKANTANKYIFVDAYTTWCGPCKMMAKNIFPNEEVGRFFNEHFINLKVQLDTTGTDDAFVQSWYPDARYIQQYYGVKVFPTYLFLDPQGTLVHRAVGASDAATFISKATHALDPEKQYYSLLKQYNKGNKNPDFLKKLAYASREAYESEITQQVVGDWVKQQKDLKTESSIRFLADFIISTRDTAFTLLLNNQAAFEKVLGRQEAQSKIRLLIMSEEIFQELWNTESMAADWGAYEKRLTTKYGANGAEAVACARLFHYQQMGEWDAFQTEVTVYMRKYGANFRPIDLNQFAWAVFENCSDPTCIGEAIGWAEKASKTNEPSYIDTYANLVYKSGNRSEAIAIQQKAVDLAVASGHTSLSDFQQTLAKMQKGEKTW